jgi:glyoxylase-like metal-dependent hydrolase (beta-lactamase superfamily II)
MSHTCIEQLWLFHCGFITVPKGVFVADAGPQKAKLPFLALLAVHPTHGPVLIDAPFGPEGPTNTGEIAGGILRKAGLVFRDEWAVVPRIQKLGFRASEVHHILMTHMHFDHTGGMKTLAHATFHINRDEWVFATSLTPLQARRHGYVLDDYRALSQHIEKLDLSDATIEDGFDVFGDQSIKAIPLPGHSVGHTGYLIRLAEKTLLFAGDAAFTVSQITQDKELGIFPQTFAKETSVARETLRELRSWHHRHPEVELLTAHDFDLGARCMEGPVALHTM